MRVLHLCAGNLYGGIERMLVTIARHAHCTPQVRHEFAVPFPGRLRDELAAAGAVVHAVPEARFSRPWTVVKLRRELKRLLSAADVLITHACWPHAIGAPVARRLGVPVVFWTHDTPSGEHWLERRAGRYPPALALANSHYTRDRLDRLFPGCTSTVMRCPVNDGLPQEARQTVRELQRREIGTAERAVVIILAARLEPWKGHALLIDALAKLSTSREWECWIVGGPQRPHEEHYLLSLKQRAESLRVRSRIRFLGQHSEVPALLLAADVHCQPNTGPEPFGIAFVEALYAGLPVVTTAIGAAPEIVGERCGILVPPDDAGGLAAALGQLIESDADRVRSSEGSRRRAAELCDPVHALNHLAATLQGIVRTGETSEVR